VFDRIEDRPHRAGSRSSAGLPVPPNVGRVGIGSVRRSRPGITAAQIAEAHKRLRQLIGRLAEVLPENGRKPSSRPIPDQYLELGKRLEKAFAEYKAEIKTRSPIVGPTFLRFPVELGRRVTINSLRQRVEEVQARLELAAPPRVSLEDGRLAVDMQRPDRQTVLFSQIRAQIAVRDEMFGNAKVLIGVDLPGSQDSPISLSLRLHIYICL